MNDFHPSEHDLHAYADGNANDSLRRQIDFYLTSHPDAVRQLEQLRQEAQLLRTSMENVPGGAIPPRLDPFRIRRELRARSQRRMAIAASLVLSLSFGALGGWQLRDMSMRKTYLPMADATQAYRMFAGNNMAQAVDLKSSESGQLQNWLNQHFIQVAPLPDFSAYGFKLVGGRLMSSDKGPAAMVLYQNDQGQTVVYYVRPPGDLFNFGTGNRREDGLLTQYWRQGRYFYAVVSPTDTPAMLPVQRAVEPARPQI